MKRLTKETKERKQPSGKWRKRFPCRRNKGEHHFKLIKPRFLRSFKNYQNLSVEQYYALKQRELEEDKKKDAKKKNSGSIGSIFGYFVTKEYECVVCGRSEYQHGIEKSKKIKVIVE